MTDVTETASVPQALTYLKQSSTDPTTSSARPFGSLPVTLPILKGLDNIDYCNTEFHSED